MSVLCVLCCGVCVCFDVRVVVVACVVRWVCLFIGACVVCDVCVCFINCCLLVCVLCVVCCLLFCVSLLVYMFRVLCVMRVGVVC